MKKLSKAEILDALDLKTEIVEVPEWGGAVTVRTMTGADRDAFEEQLVRVGPDGKREPDLRNMRAKLVALTVIDENGDRMFNEDDIRALTAKSAAALARVADAAQRLNGLGADSVEEAEKN